MLELVDLGYKRDALVTSLSRGMTQRLGLARVLLHEPQVLLLDEPASGLDPRARIEMRELLKELRSMKKTILVSSHILPGAGRHLQQDRHHRARQAALQRRRRDGHRARCGRSTSSCSSVGADRNEEAAKELAGYPEVESVDLLDQGEDRQGDPPGRQRGRQLPARAADPGRATSCGCSRKKRSTWKTCSWGSPRASRTNGGRIRFADCADSGRIAFSAAGGSRNSAATMGEER